MYTFTPQHIPVEEEATYHELDDVSFSIHVYTNLYTYIHICIYIYIYTYIYIMYTFTPQHLPVEEEATYHELDDVSFSLVSHPCYCLLLACIGVCICVGRGGGMLDSP